MDQVAEEAGVAKATLYDNFDGKPGLTEALLDHYGSQLLGQMSLGLDRPRSGRDLVRGGIVIFVRFIESDPEIYRFIAGNAGETSIVEETATPIGAMIAGFLEAADADPAPAEPVAHALLGAVFVASEWWAERRSMPRAQFVDFLVEFVWSGLVGIGVADDDRPLDLTLLTRTLAEETGSAAGESE